MYKLNVNRASYNRPNPNIHCGKPKQPAATGTERSTLLQISQLAKDAAQATSTTTMQYQVSEVYRLTRQIIAGRKS